MKSITYLKSANRVTHTHLVLRVTNDVITRGIPMELTARNRSVIRRARPGDLLKFDRGAYFHWAVYIGSYIYIYKLKVNVFACSV